MLILKKNKGKIDFINKITKNNYNYILNKQNFNNYSSFIFKLILHL